MQPLPPIMRVFISSTFQDLQDYRQAASRAIHSLESYSDDMIYWSADPRDGATHSVERVKQCDLLILILAHRYGYIPEGGTYSVTELEYRTAVEHKIPVLAFFLDETVPWPPAFIENDKSDELNAFKRLVETQVTRKLFRSAEQLEALISQAMYAYLDRHKRQFTQADALNQSAKVVASAAELKSRPDLLLHVGQSVEGLPLLIEVTRSEPLDQRLATIRQIITKYSADSLVNLFETMKQELEFHAQQLWSGKSIRPVRMRDGSTQEMYVTQNTLTELFRSTLSTILGHSQNPVVQFRDRQESVFSTQTHHPYDELGTQIPAVGESLSGELESRGGLNRFLGISTTSGNTYSVGRRGIEWVEWRAFFSEVISPTFETARVIAQGLPIALHDYENHILNVMLKSIGEPGPRAPDTTLVVSRQSVARAILKIAAQVETIHAENRIHGDLKPKNVLLTENGPLLIDQFDLTIGEIAPGWTVNWSAPEQALGEPATRATDIYPLGRMLARLLDAKLVGELRMFSVPTGLEPQLIYVSPSLFVEDHERILATRPAYDAWRNFIVRCLRFDPTERPQTVSEFSDELGALSETYPIEGDIAVDIPGEITVGRMPDGSVRICRIIRDGMRAYTAYPGPPPPMIDVSDDTSHTLY